MKKLVNLRVPVLLAVLIAVGIALGYIFEYYGLNFLWIAAIILPLAIIFICLVIFVKNKRIAVLVALAAIFTVGGAANCFFRLEDFDNTRLDDGGSYAITARIAEKGRTAYGEYIILTGAKANGTDVDGKIVAYLGESYGEFCEEGYTVKFFAKINKNALFKDGKLNYFAEDNVKYVCNVYGGLTAKYGFSLFGKVRAIIRDTLYENVDKDIAAIAYAMLTGNTQSVDSESLTVFRYGGIAHIFAVSGLHIGIVYGALALICKKAKFNKYISATICLMFIFFYAGVCGFTPSSLRAAVMCGVACLSHLTYQKYDSFNSLALSVILLLAITPLSLFAVGFQLSVCAVGGIILLSKRIVKLLSFLPKKASQPIAVSLSAQAGIVPVMALNFGYLSWTGLFMNVVAVPILSAIFILLFVCTVLSLILPFAAAVIMPCAAVPLEFIISIFVNAGFENAIFYIDWAYVFIPPYYILLAILSDKFNLKRRA